MDMTVNYNKLANDHLDTGRNIEDRALLTTAFEKKYSDKHGHTQADIEFREYKRSDKTIFPKRD